MTDPKPSFPLKLADGRKAIDIITNRLIDDPVWGYKTIKWEPVRKSVLRDQLTDALFFLGLPTRVKLASNAHYKGCFVSFKRLGGILWVFFDEIMVFVSIVVQILFVFFIPAAMIYMPICY